MTFQPGIWKEPPPAARFLTFHLIPDEDPLEPVRELAETTDEDTVVGFGQAALARLGTSIAGLREPAAISGAGASVPANPAALWLWLRGSDRGELVHRTHALADAVEEAFEMTSVAEAFTHDTGRDLSGFKLGAGNPKGDMAVEAAFVSGQGAGLDGSSFVAVQRWVHDLPRLGSYSPREQDDFIGRTKAADEETGRGAPVRARQTNGPKGLRPARLCAAALDAVERRGPRRAHLRGFRALVRRVRGVLAADVRRRGRGSGRPVPLHGAHRDELLLVSSIRGRTTRPAGYRALGRAGLLPDAAEEYQGHEYRADHREPGDLVTGGVGEQAEYRRRDHYRRALNGRSVPDSRADLARRRELGEEHGMDAHPGRRRSAEAYRHQRQRPRRGALRQQRDRRQHRCRGKSRQ